MLTAHRKSFGTGPVFLFAFAMLLSAMVGLLTACGKSDSNRPTGSGAPSGNGQASEPPPPPTVTTSGYSTLAASLADPFLNDRDEPSPHKELAQLFAEARVKIVRYQSIQTPDPMIRMIADEAADSGSLMVDSHQALDAMNQDSHWATFIVGAIGLYLGDATAVISGVSTILEKGNAEQQERIKWGSAFNRSRAAQLMLPEAAKAFGGPTNTVGGLVGIDFDESFEGVSEYDSIALTNTSGKTLTHCTVLVELQGIDGDVRQNVHYVSSWDPGVKQFARYGLGVESDNVVYGRRTVNLVQKIRVSVWADEASQEHIAYTYAGAELNNDFKAALDGKMKIRFRYDRSTFWGTGPEVFIVLDGVPAVPKHTLTLTFRTSANADVVPPVALEWLGSDWRIDEGRTLSLGSNLDFDPETMEIKVTFPGIDYVYKRKVNIKND